MNLDAIKLLKIFKNKFEPILQRYFDEKIYQAGKIDITTKEAVDMIKDYTMSGGKRIRPAFLYYSYLATGGHKEFEKILKISIAIELFHSFLLIHDDIFDKDTSRHGVATIHERYKKIAEKYNVTRDRTHFGNSMAIMLGNMTASMAYEIILNADFKSDLILKALNKIQKIVFMTISGQMIDVTMSYENEATERKIFKMNERKTAHYTFEGPIQLGCILAGASESYIDLFSAYALPLGKAFQIKDDIMGIFGNEKKIGKSVGSDISENKKTLLVAKALQNGNKEQKKIIKKYLGKENISKKEIEEFKKIIKETGSLKYSENLAKGFAGEALNALLNIDFKDENAKRFFTGIVDYVINREL